MKSMTGYGAAFRAEDGRECSVEVKGVNHRFLDLSFRAPRQLNFLEDSWRKQIAARVGRGHLDVFINYRNTRDDSRQVIVDEPLAIAYIQAFSKIEGLIRGERETADRPRIAHIAQMPEVLRAESAPDDRDVLAALCAAALGEALDAMTAMREREGATLRRDLADKLHTLECLRVEIEALAPSVIADYREKLNQRIRDAIDAYPDPIRLATEIALIADRSAIDEEIARLSSHIDQMLGMLDSDQPTGRKLDFLVQEMLREANTIGSKSMSAAVTRLVVQAKGEIEKLREQIQNI